MNKYLLALIIVIVVSVIAIVTVICIGSGKNDAVITVIDGYVAVNGEKTEHKVHTEPVITLIDGYVAVNGVKTEYEVDSADVITVDGGYLVVNGVKTAHKVHTNPVITVIDGYVAVNGVKTDYIASTCEHVWNTVTTAPACITGGYSITSCTLCEKSMVHSETPSLNHPVDGDGVCTICNLPTRETDGIAYDISDDNTYVTVGRYSGTATRVKIAEEYNGLPVKKIDAEAFSQTDITYIEIPDSVETIGENAFFECFDLEEVVLPDNLKSIGDMALFTIGNSQKARSNMRQNSIYRNSQ